MKSTVFFVSVAAACGSAHSLWIGKRWEEEPYSESEIFLYGVIVAVVCWFFLCLLLKLLSYIYFQKIRGDRRDQGKPIAKNDLSSKSDGS